MITAKLRAVLDGISGLMGAEPVTAGDPDHVAFIASINRHTERGWQFDFWPEWTPVELRAYRDAWAAPTTYAPGAEVFFTDLLYYSANLAPNNPAAGQSPASAPTKWTLLTTFARYVALDQTGQTPIGEVSRVCRNDPRLYPTKPGAVNFDITYQGIVPDRRAGVQVYVEFRLRPPQFTAVVWDAVTVFAVGDVRYDDATGDCYKAVQAGANHSVTDAAFWSKVAFPQRLKSFVETASYADALRGDGQTGKALAEQGNADNFLLQANDAVFAGQGQ